MEHILSITSLTFSKINFYIPLLTKHDHCPSMKEQNRILLQMSHCEMGGSPLQDMKGCIQDMPQLLQLEHRKNFS